MLEDALAPDDKLIYVSPENLYYCYANDTIDQDDKWTSIQPQHGYIPILSANLRAYKIELLKKLRFSGQNNVSPSIKKEKKNLEPNEKITTKPTESTGSKKYLIPEQFIPDSLEKQLRTLTVILKDALYLGKNNRFIKENEVVSDDTRLLILDEFLKLIIPNYIDSLANWTLVDLNKGTDDESLLYLRFNESGTQSMISFYKKHSKMAKYMEIHYDTNTEKYINDNFKDDGDEDNVEAEQSHSVGEILKSMETAFEKARSQVGTFKGDINDDQDDKINYKIDYNTLLDIPSDSLEQLTKEILNFRTKVIDIEKQKQLRQQYEDNERRQKHMTQLFEKLRKGTKSNDSNRNMDIESTDTINDSDGEEDDDEDDEDDLAIEKRKEEKRKEEEARKYRALLKDYETTIEPHLHLLSQQYKQNLEYEKELAANREANVKDLLRQANDIYYDKDRSFKDREEQEDKLDREKYGDIIIEDIVIDDDRKGQKKLLEKDKKVKKAGEPAIKINLAFKKAMDNSIQDKRDKAEDIEPVSQPIEARSTNRYAALKEKRVVDELVKELLGVYEDDVVAYVFEILEKPEMSDEKKQSELVTEMEDLFDKEGAVQFAEQVFKALDEA
ncbi:U1 small nuclear ribonucleoprotein component SNU71 [Nakaseomyces glabratus]|uniref:U1 small nuclear ribonucleoprotein component SNU71 n=1 Tax=Candida glabrata TaxID=5478 RepID=A0A0W0CE87_CANGB|nr:U1 small nuclear ribonucleoprotein component SNU71 [Nakaseomyces glabratus]KTA97989.1 U1 small nuclear ribonucleoprotein component SNU71 [Nakaseomyces glabratus]KTA98759.1 U1 small nuclear ribonucleoprotein component SNU71 [Nakaseomyces glabratus]KTB14819.1 U1 small nuclear ribonucleoprotein component SNU71 [Nakaseomyces glabratus]